MVRVALAIVGCVVSSVALLAAAAQPAKLADVVLSAYESRANDRLTGTVSLTGPAPSCGVLVRLQSSDPVVSVPRSVWIPAGQMSASFPLTTGPSLSRNGVAIVATYEASAQSALLTVLPGI